MNWEAAAFWMLATMVIVPALFIIWTKNIVHMAFWLLGTLMGVAGLYLLMGADFLGMTQIFVYIGGINVLLLFGIMLTNRDPIFVRHTSQRPARTPAVILAGLLLAGLFSAIMSTEWSVTPPGDPEPTTSTLGTYLLSDYILPFEMISVLLLVVLVGAAYIARRGTGEKEAS